MPVEPEMAEFNMFELIELSLTHPNSPPVVDVSETLYINAELLKQYVEFIAGKRMHAVRQEKIFNTGTNPLPWTQAWITGGEVQVAPQETEISSYVIGGTKQDVNGSTFAGMKL